MRLFKEEILLALENIAKRESSAYTKYKEVVEQCRKDRLIVQKECSHEWRYYPDPSGNNDSEYICDICEKSQRRIN